jgi:hypothetical protein
VGPAGLRLSVSAPNHGRHLRKTNVVASLFATGQLRTTADKLDTHRGNATAMSWTVRQGVAQPFQRLQAPELLPAVSASRQDGHGAPTHHVVHQEGAV